MNLVFFNRYKLDRWGRYWVGRIIEFLKGSDRLHYKPGGREANGLKKLRVSRSPYERVNRCTENPLSLTLNPSEISVEWMKSKKFFLFYERKNKNFLYNRIYKDLLKVLLYKFLPLFLLNFCLKLYSLDYVGER